MTLTTLLLLVFAPCITHAQQDTTKKVNTAERRKAIREKWQNATPEQKEKAKEKAKEMKAKYDSLPPEKQQKIKDKLKERREKVKQG